MLRLLSMAADADAWMLRLLSMAADANDVRSWPLKFIDRRSVGCTHPVVSMLAGDGA